MQCTADRTALGANRMQLKDQALKVMLVSGDCFLIGLQVCAPALPCPHAVSCLYSMIRTSVPRGT